MTETDPEPTPGNRSPLRKRIAMIVVIVVLAALPFICIAPESINIPITLAAYVCGGWFRFLQRVGPQMELSGFGIAVGLAAFGGLIAGIQVAIRKFAPTSDWPIRQTTRAVFGVLAIVLGGICLVGLGHELSWWGRSPTPLMSIQVSFLQRTQSRSNLKQIGLAVHDYHDSAQTFPPGGTFGSDGAAGHGWMACVLPYFDASPLYSRIDFSRPWHDPVNREVYQTRVPPYENPWIAAQNPVSPGEYAPAHYAANGHVLSANRGLWISEIKDGTSHTLFAGEVKERFRPWGDVVNWRFPEQGINRSPQGFGGPFRGGAHFLMSDGSVQFISETIDPIILKALGTPAGGDRVGEF